MASSEVDGLDQGTISHPCSISRRCQTCRPCKYNSDRMRTGARPYRCCISDIDLSDCSAMPRRLEDALALYRLSAQLFGLSRSGHLSEARFQLKKSGHVESEFWVDAVSMVLRLTRRELHGH